jgi:hypothetical protein
MLNPYPQLDAAGGTNVVARNVAEYVRHWYFGLNGRWSQALMNGTLAGVTKLFGFGPESFPWWMMRSLSLFCMLATPLNFLAAAGAFRPHLRLMGIFLLAIVWGTWSLSQNTYAYSVWFDCLLTDRFVPMYLTSVLSVGVASGWPTRRPLHLLGFAAVYLFVAVEQFLVTLPVLLAAYALRDLARTSASRAFRIFVGSIALSALSSVIYFSSPGQQWRNSLMNVKAPDLSPVAIFNWFQEATPLAYGVLFGPRHGAIYWSLHALLLVAGLTTLLALALRSDRLRKLAAKINTKETGRWVLLATCFNAAYAASLSTLLVSPHFPEYAAQYPALLLTLGLIFSFAAVVSTADRPLAILVTAVSAIGVLFAITLPAVRANVASFREEAAYGRLRKAAYRQVVDLNRQTGASAFVLTNSPTRSIGGTMEPPWGLSAYFRWIGQNDLLVFIDTNYDFATRPKDRQYTTIDVSEYWLP